MFANCCMQCILIVPQWLLNHQQLMPRKRNITRLSFFWDFWDTQLLGSKSWFSRHMHGYTRPPALRIGIFSQPVGIAQRKLILKQTNGTNLLVIKEKSSKKKKWYHHDWRKCSSSLSRRRNRRNKIT